MASDLGHSVCRVDSWVLNGGKAWFRCHYGTLGCPVSHDGLTPHCVECVADGPCRYHHDPPAIERTWEEHQKIMEASRA